jgi:hypothetical protein
MSASIHHLHHARWSLTTALRITESELESAPSLALAERVGSIRALLSGMDSMVAPDEIGDTIPDPPEPPDAW